MNITKDIIYVGVNDTEVDLFEGQYKVPEGMCYNSYLILDEKIAVMDTVDKKFTHEWLWKIKSALGDRKPDYLIVQHMEPDHSANIANFMKVYPQCILVSSQKAFAMINQFFGEEYADRKLVVKEGDTLSLGSHELTFVMAPMVHWPEVMVTYDAKEKLLFSADGFGKFGTFDCDEEWIDEARRYYIGIVGKYGAQVQALLKKAAGLDIEIICPLHGPVLKENLGCYIKMYDIWSSYAVETDGIVIAYSSIYGNTKKAAEMLYSKVRAKGAEAEIYDLARCDKAEAVAAAFRYSKLVLATTTYNNALFPCMREFIEELKERNYQGRTVGIIENGTWAPTAAKNIRKALEESKNITFTENTVTIKSALSADSTESLEALACELCKDYTPAEVKEDPTALFNIGYGLYVVTSNDGMRDNGLIVNTVSQLTNNPDKVSVTINKNNYSHYIIKKTGKLNINCLSEEAPFSVFQNFGFRSGVAENKFEGIAFSRSQNGLTVLSQYVNGFISLEVEEYHDMGSHGMFICKITESKKLSDKNTMSYTYYHQNVKPKPEKKTKKGFVCKICGYVYEGETLPEDFICPLCKHPVSDFEPLA